jgi:hypothetical protein
MTNTKTVELSVELVNSILNYMGNRPFIEVADLIAAIQKEASSRGQEMPEEDNEFTPES